MAQKKEKRQPKGDHSVGYCRPPAEHQFRPGQSGNPTGQRKGSHGKTTADELKEVASTKVTIRDGDETRKVSLLAANFLAHGLNGAKGDARSAALFLNQANKMGLYDQQGRGDVPAIEPSSKPRPSDVVLGDLDLGLLSRDEQVELSKLAAIINRDGNIWVLNASELELMRELVNKGRGKDITRH